MGCGVYSKDSTSGSVLSSREVSLIKESWTLIHEEELAIGVYIYYSFLQTEMDLRALFPKIIYSESKGETLSLDDDMLQKHALIVMRALGETVERLDNPAHLGDFLCSVGEKHYSMNVKPAMLERIWPTIDDSFNAVLKDVYTKELRDTWRKLLLYIITCMKSGISVARAKDQ